MLRHNSINYYDNNVYISFEKDIGLIIHQTNYESYEIILISIVLLWFHADVAESIIFLNDALKGIIIKSCGIFK